MAKVQNSPAVGADDERFLKALSDTDLMKYASKSKYREDTSNAEDYKNAKFKVLQYRKEKAERAEREGKMKSDGKSQPRRRRRKSTGSRDKRRRKADAEKHRTKVEEIIPVLDNIDLEDPHLDPKTQKIKHNTLSSYFSSPHEEGSKQVRRSCRSIDTSSTQKTKKQSNSSGPKPVSVNELVNNSAWAKERIRRVPRNSRLRDKMDNHYLSTPASNGTTRKHFRKYRSETDITALNRSDSGSRTKPRRKYRSNMSGSIDVISNNATFPASPITPITPAVAAAKSTRSTSKATYITDPGLITPYTGPPEFRGKSTPRSYSDRVMVAAESSKTPMANLKKYLKEEKMFSSSGNVSTSSGPKETMSVDRIPRKSKKLSNSLLQIPFSDGTSNTSESRGEEADNKTKALSVQSIGKSVAKTMKRQAKNTKRKIGRQINKLTASNKPTDIGSSDDNSQNNQDRPLPPLRAPSGILPDGVSAGIQNSPVALRPPSGLFPDENDSITLSSPISPMGLKPPSGKLRTKPGLNTLNPPLEHGSMQESDLLSPSEIDQKSEKKSRKKTGKKHRSKKKKRSKRHLLDEDSEVSFDEIGQSSAALGLDFYTTENMVSPSAQFHVFEDDVPEDSTIERSYRINPALHTKHNDDGDSTIDDGSKLMSPRSARPYVSSTDSLISAGFSPKMEDRKDVSNGATSTTVPSSPSSNQSATNQSNKLEPNFSTIQEEEEQCEENNDSNDSEAEGSEEKEANNLMSIPIPPLHQDPNNTDGTAEKEVVESEPVDFQEVLEQETTEELDLSLELYALLKKESRAKDRKEAARKAFEERKRELERLKQNHQQLMEMDITVDHDPLAVSEISLPPHIMQQQSPRRTQESIKREHRSRSRDAQRAKTSKEKKSKPSRRGSKSKGRKKKDRIKIAAVEAKDDIAAQVVNESNSQILNLRMMLLQSNPTL